MQSRYLLIDRGNS